jgi:predicted HicB family RNase H-like nuclease
MKKNKSNKHTSTPFLAARCSAELRAQAEAAAKERGWNLGALVREAVEQYLSSAEPPASDGHRKVDGRSASWLKS